MTMATIETEVEATHGAHLWHSLFAPALELMDDQREHPGYEDVILTHQQREPIEPWQLARCDAWLRRERARRCVDPAGLRRTYGKGGEPELAAIPEEVR
jgi:hypothetical protein